MISQRFHSILRHENSRTNYQFIGFTHLLSGLSDILCERKGTVKMIEIGSYMGESTMLFASTGLFSTIDVIEPHDGYEKFNEMHNHDWIDVKKEFENNIRNFDMITHHKKFSYEISNLFKNNSYDFIYIDADHKYESVIKDVELYLPKLKKGGIIGGHDYCPYIWPDVVRAVNETIGEPDSVTWDTSWLKVLNEVRS